MSKHHEFRDFVLNHEFDQFAKDEEGRAIFRLWQDEYEALQSAMASAGGGLSSIAQKKLEQMGATVHGVLVKNEAGAWAAVSDLGRVTWLESDKGEDPPAEHTSDYSCPDCGAKMTQANPADPYCDALYCNECGFNEPADSEDGADIDGGTKPVPERDIDPLFEGPDVPIGDALGAMEEERRLNDEHLKDDPKPPETEPKSDPLPCPFCGSSDVGGAGGTVGCYRCPAEIAVQNANTAYAVELWNNRAQSAKGAEVASGGEVEALRGQLESAEAMVAVQSDVLENIAVALKDAGNLSKEMYELITKGIGADPDPFILRKQAEAVEAIKPTSEMKAEMLGSFKFTEEMTCSACYFDEPDNDCEVCGGDVTYAQDFQIPWTSQKQIIGTAAAHVAQRLRQQADEADRAGRDQ
ncbi:hypothetical protein [Marinobacter subterrani]|uniref:Uncharacterized protein n=1 Tax=Marinobacter subterrani TaxID=1658765 RepID=A0A0J7J9Y6_9GAMM|nr:hypothetical protein [Marinobacter subterrani]KMQ75258.1 hypothetical protein Msub_11459 [Marinobacter subterrani]